MTNVTHTKKLKLPSQHFEVKILKKRGRMIVGGGEPTSNDVIYGSPLLQVCLVKVILNM